MPRSYTLFLNTRDATATSANSSFVFTNINWDVVFGGGFARNPTACWQVTHTMVSEKFYSVAVSVIKLSGLVKCTGFHNTSTSFYSGATNSVQNGTFINTFQPLGSYTNTTNDAVVLVSTPLTFMIGQPTGMGTLTISLLSDTSTAAIPVPVTSAAANPSLNAIHNFVFTLVE